MLIFVPMQFSKQLLSWYNEYKRALPWRDSPTPYATWISEIILQQTRVNQGLDYYLRFMGRFPTVEALAQAEESAVLKAWQGLGYYTRARNLHKAAQKIMQDYDGELPATFTELKKLPGIGDYTAAAIASIAFGEAVPAIDGNAYRVYARYLGLPHDIGGGKAFPFFFEAGKALISHQAPGDFNQAIMELGATLCKPKNPACMFCPVQSSCYAFSRGVAEKFPVKTKKLQVREERMAYVYLYSENRFLLRHRNAKGIWQNMYDFPEYQSLKDRMKTPPPVQESLVHVLTHKRLQIDFMLKEVSPLTLENIAEEGGYIIAKTKDLPRYATPKPIHDFILKYIKK